MRDLTKVMLTALFVAVVLVGLMPTLQVSAQTPTWDPTLGWDFEDHTNTHAHLRQLTDAQISAELQAVNDAFALHGYPAPRHLAYPYGDYGKNVADRARIQAVVSQFRDSGRVVFGQMDPYPVPDWYVLKAAQLKRATGWSKIQGWINEAIATNSLLHIFTHDVSARPSSYGCTPEKLAQLLDYLKQKQDAGELQVMTMAEAYDVWSTATTNPKPTVVISFDDANESDFTAVYPLFVARGLKGTSYIVTGFIDQPGSLTWAEIALMRAGA